MACNTADAVNEKGSDSTAREFVNMSITAQNKDISTTNCWR